MSDTIVIDRRASLMTVGIRRPEKRNALDESMFAALAAVFEKANRSEDIAAVIIQGTSECFCAGHDLAAFERLWPQPNDGVIARCIGALIGLTKPMVAAVCGPAIGFGATLLLSADYVVAGESATFRFPFAQLGIVPEAGSSALLARRVGDLCARDWLMSGRVIDAPEALDKGFVSTVTADADVEATALRYAVNLASKPVNAVREIRQLIKSRSSQSQSL
jgi:enoyl-CoA hydratase/carnithine racemase